MTRRGIRWQGAVRLRAAEAGAAQCAMWSRCGMRGVMRCDAMQHCRGYARTHARTQIHMHSRDGIRTMWVSIGRRDTSIRSLAPKDTWRGWEHPSPSWLVGCCKAPWVVVLLGAMKSRRLRCGEVPGVHLATTSVPPPPTPVSLARSLAPPPPAPSPPPPPPPLPPPHPPFRILGAVTDRSRI